ncbi:hypothetical protein Tco_0624065, partial [Tanacetum coccineum]
MQRLLYPGSSHTFIDYALAVKLGSKKVKGNHMGVKVADGNKTQCDIVVKGIEWFATLEKVTFGFHNRSIDFDHR